MILSENHQNMLSKIQHKCCCNVMSALKWQQQVHCCMLLQSVSEKEVMYNLDCIRVVFALMVITVTL